MCRVGKERRGAAELAARCAVGAPGLAAAAGPNAHRPSQSPAQPADVGTTLVSDVQVNVLLYPLKIYYEAVNRSCNGQQLLSTVEVRTNQGDFAFRTEWKNDHYDMVVNQYKHHYRATGRQPITCTVTAMFFGEPPGASRADAEYFGNFLTLLRPAAGQLRTTQDGREDEYRYVNGQLMTIIKKNPLKNFIIRLEP